MADDLAAIAELEAEYGTITPSAENRAWATDVLPTATDDQRLAG